MRKYNLEERAALFSEELINFYKQYPKNTITSPLIDQGLRSGTSIGANYCEANGASSRNDFKNKIFTCKKEGKETMYWLRLIESSLENEQFKRNCLALRKEAFALVINI